MKQEMLSRLLSSITFYYVSHGHKRTKQDAFANIFTVSRNGQPPPNKAALYA